MTIQPFTKDISGLFQARRQEAQSSMIMSSRLPTRLMDSTGGYLDYVRGLVDAQQKEARGRKDFESQL